jgi:hypothetical protein
LTQKSIKTTFLRQTMKFFWDDTTPKNR